MPRLTNVKRVENNCEVDMPDGVTFLLVNW